jgi:hypothetical protein
LGNIKSKDTISLLTSILSDKKEDTEVRRGAALALGRIGTTDQKAISALESAQREPSLKIPCLCALIELGATKKEPKELVSLFKEANLSDKNLLFSALWKITD